MTSLSRPLLSVIVPCYNEEQVIGICHERIAAVTLALPDYLFEILYIDDGSSDQTRFLLHKLQQVDHRIRLIGLSRNFGKELALTAGLDNARGDAVIILDADLQDPPELIPELLRVWREQDADVVYGQRTSREGESRLKKTTAYLFYRVMNRISGKVHIPRDTGDFRLMTRRAVEDLKRLRETHRFMKGLFAWIGYKQVAVPYVRERRAAGRTHWNYLSLWNLSLEGITGFSMLPLRFAGVCGLLISMASLAYACFIVIRTLVRGTDVPGFPSIIVMISFLSGIQLLSIGVLGEYIGRIFDETKNRPLYIINENSGGADG